MISAVLKKKHSKTGEESRYQGTVLGKPAEERPIRIEGGDYDSIQAWEARLRKTQDSGNLSPAQETSPNTITEASSPLTDLGDV